MLEDQVVGGFPPGSADSPSAPQGPASQPGALPAPDPSVADSARLRLAAYRPLSAGPPAGPPAGRASSHPAEDIQAITAVIDAARGDADRPADALDLGAALVVLCDLRLYLDGLEADLLDAAPPAGLGWDVIAAIIGIPADEARHRHQALRARRILP
jgi:hypothetical protein